MIFKLINKLFRRKPKRKCFREIDELIAELEADPVKAAHLATAREYWRQKFKDLPSKK